MRKKGFTLAEVLITLGIVGVVAALTIPAMTQNVARRQVGPALAKAINNLEMANKKALADNDARRLGEVNEDYFTLLDSQLAGNIIEKNQLRYYITNDGITYLDNSVEEKDYYALNIDINGNSKHPNLGGIDIFKVYVTQSGAVIAAGSRDAVTLGEHTSVIDCNDSATPKTEDCTNTIIEDGWEMKY